MQKTTRLQRLLAVVVAVFMAVCCLPLNAFAAGANENVKFYVEFLDEQSRQIGWPEEVEAKTDDEGLVDLNELQYTTLSSDYTVDKTRLQKVAVDAGGTYCVYVTKKPVEPEQKSTYTFNFYQVGDTSKTIRDSVSVTITDFDNLVDKHVMDYFVSARAELEATGEWTYDHYENAYNPGVPGQPSAVVVPGMDMVYNVYFNKVEVAPEVKPSTYTFNFYQVGDTSKTIRDSVTVTIEDFDNLVDKYVMDRFAAARAELEATGEWKYDHYENAYNPGEAGQTDAVVVPDVNMVYNVYFKPVSVEPEQKSTYTFNFYELGNKDNVLYTAYTVEVTDFSENAADKYVMDLFAEGRKAVEDTGKWTYVSYESDYNPGVEGQVDALIVPNVNMVYNVYFAPVSAEKKSTYTFNFYETDNKDKVLHEPVTVTVTDFDNLVDKYVMDLFATARKEVEDSGNWSYNFYESEYGIEGQVDSLVVPGVNLSYNVYFNCKDRSSKYTIHFVDENNNEFQDPTVVNMAWVEGQDLNLMTQLDSTLKNVNGYTFKSLTTWNGKDQPFKGDEVVVPGEYELIAHYTKNTTSSSSDNNNTTTVSSNNNKTNNTQVVKAAAPADNTAKVMPQTGLTAETPVVFGVMMVAALAGAGAYLFAIRKKLN